MPEATCIEAEWPRRSGPVWGLVGGQPRVQRVSSAGRSSDLQMCVLRPYHVLETDDLVVEIAQGMQALCSRVSKWSSLPRDDDDWTVNANDRVSRLCFLLWFGLTEGR